MKAKLGRKTKFSKDRVAKILDAIGRGLGYAQAAHLSGISERTLYAWKADGEKPQFLQAVQKASAVAELDMLETIHDASKKQWQAAAWLLERKWPEPRPTS